VPTPVPLENFGVLPEVHTEPYTYGSAPLTQAAEEAEPAAKVLEPPTPQ
jgi:hypothetical protein